MRARLSLRCFSGAKPPGLLLLQLVLKLLKSGF